MKLLGLKQIRKIYGLTMRDLAKLLNVSPNTINLWENGDIDVPDERVETIERALGINKILFFSKLDSRQLMLVELARASYKADEYRRNIILDGSDEKILEENKKEFEEQFNKINFKIHDRIMDYEDLQDLIRSIIYLYSDAPKSWLEEINEFLFDTVNNLTQYGSDYYEKLKVVTDALWEGEDMECFGDEYYYECSVEDYLEKTIRDCVEKLINIKKFKRGKIIPKYDSEE